MNGNVKRYVTEGRKKWELKLLVLLAPWKTKQKIYTTHSHYWEVVLTQVYDVLRAMSLLLR